MNFSSASILKMQRLARTVKKELSLPVHIRSKEGIGELLRWAQSETKNAAVFEVYSDFISTLTEQDKKELISYNVAITENSTSNVTEVAPHDFVVEEERRKVDIAVEPERRLGKSVRYYRGAAIEYIDDALPHAPELLEERREVDIPVELERRTEKSTQYYRGVEIERADEAEVAEIKPKKKKRVRMYRGQPIED